MRRSLISSSCLGRGTVSVITAPSVDEAAHISPEGGRLGDIVGVVLIHVPMKPAYYRVEIDVHVDYFPFEGILEVAAETFFWGRS